MPKKKSSAPHGKSPIARKPATNGKTSQPKKPASNDNSGKIQKTPKGKNRKRSGTVREQTQFRTAATIARERLKKRIRAFMPSRDEDGLFHFLEEFIQVIRGGDGVTRLKPNVPREVLSQAPTLSDFVGSAFNHATASTAPGYHFDRYLRLLMDRIRNYNRALYRLRRAHFINDFDSPPVTEPMRELDNEALVLPPRTNVAAFKREFREIEDAFVAAAENLCILLRLPLEDFPDPLTGKALFVDGVVDCIHVNDYIVSIRAGAIASETNLATNTRMELPFSSSSHISISSVFSSYSSLSTWHAEP